MTTQKKRVQIFGETIDTILLASECTYTDVHREYITPVRLRAAPDGMVRITATNGQMLSDQVVRDAGLAELLGNRDAFVPRRGFKLLASFRGAFKKTINFGAERVEGEPEESGIAVGHGGMTFMFYDRCPGTQPYPDVDMVIPKSPANPNRISFNAEMLVKMAKAGARNSGLPQIVIEFDEPLKPIRVYRGGGGEADLIGVLMPCRL